MSLHRIYVINVGFRSLSGNRIKFIPEGLLQKTPGLTHLELKGNPLVAVEHQAFSSLPRLRKLQVLLYFYYLFT